MKIFKNLHAWYHIPLNNKEYACIYTHTHRVGVETQELSSQPKRSWAEVRAFYYDLHANYAYRYLMWQDVHIPFYRWVKNSLQSQTVSEVIGLQSHVCLNSSLHASHLTSPVFCCWWWCCLFCILIFQSPLWSSRSFQKVCGKCISQANCINFKLCTKTN